MKKYIALGFIAFLFTSCISYQGGYSKKYQDCGLIDATLLQMDIININFVQFSCPTKQPIKNSNKYDNYQVSPSYNGNKIKPLEVELKTNDSCIVNIYINLYDVQLEYLKKTNNSIILVSQIKVIDYKTHRKFKKAYMKLKKRKFQSLRKKEEVLIPCDKAQDIISNFF